MTTLYFSAVFLQGSDEWDAFERHAYPEREGSSLGFPDKSAALDYLISLVPDDMPEPDDSEIMHAAEYPRVHDGGFQNWAENDEWVACWDASYGIAGLWRKEETTVRERAYVSDSEGCNDPDCFTCIFCAPGA